MNKEKRVPIIANRVKEAVARKGITQKQLCEELHFDRHYFSRCLKEGKISDSILNELAKKLDCSPVWLSKESCEDEQSTHIEYERKEAEKNDRDIIKEFFRLLEIPPETVDELDNDEIFDLVHQCSLIAFSIIHNRKALRKKYNVTDEFSALLAMRQEARELEQHVERANDIYEERRKNIDNNRPGQPSTPQERKGENHE